ncbi:MAG: DUF2207 domain-containing protein [Bacteroidales bacterium]|nr:DUF2207 domain-containing protein [Bacteroidales bacterium]
MRIRSWILAVLLVLPLQVLPAAAQNQVHDVDISVELTTDGSAWIREVWDMTLSRGTEVYLGRENLGDIKILDLSVIDETGERYETDRYWDTDRSFERKKGHCGLNNISGGYEICWGIGEYGHRTYTVTYKLTNLVKSLDDYDMIHYQFYTPNDFRGEHVKVTIEKPGFVMDTLTRIWAFGYDGYIWREDGKVIAESENPLEPNYSIIVLMRFDKGTFDSKSVQERPFSAVLDRALEGADEPDVPMSRREEILYTILGAVFFFGMILLPFLPLIVRIVQKRKKKKDAFGTLHLKSLPWSRELPYRGDILKNYYVISTLPDLKTKKDGVASAMILHMMQAGCLEATRDLATGKVDIHFNASKGFSEVDHTEERLWSMMFEASGENHVLEEKEFSTWAKSHKSKLYNWTTDVKNSGLSKLRAGGYYSGGKFTDTGRAENCKIIGFKKFLEDTTLLRERTTPEVTLWRDYLIFASLIGIADKVAKELKDISPVMFEQACSMAYNDMSRVLYLTNSYADVVSRFATPPVSSYSGGGSLGGFSRSGGGGHSSFGGGGGFSGGGHSGVR